MIKPVDAQHMVIVAPLAKSIAFVLFLQKILVRVCILSTEERFTKMQASD
jgi:hypothetical protein